MGSPLGLRIGYAGWLPSQVPVQVSIEKDGSSDHVAGTAISAVLKPAPSEVGSAGAIALSEHPMWSKTPKRPAAKMFVFKGMNAIIIRCRMIR
jgi:anti-sigma factor RsiW